MDGNEIRLLRKKINLTQEKFASLIGVTRLTVVFWENGESKPSPLALSRLEEIKKQLNIN